MRTTPLRWTRPLGLAALSLALLAPELSAQTPNPPAADAPKEPAALTADETVQLSPFQVNTEKDKGYRATNSISGSRLDTAIKDIPIAVSI